MDTTFMNSENSRTSKPCVLIIKLTDKLHVRICEKIIALSNLTIYYTWKNIKCSYKNNKFKISAPTWNKKFELPDESYSVSNIQDYFEYIFKKEGENINQLSVQKYSRLSVIRTGTCSNFPLIRTVFHSPWIFLNKFN